MRVDSGRLIDASTMGRVNCQAQDVVCMRWEWRGEGRRASPGWNLLFSAQQGEQLRSVRLLSS